MPARIPSVRGHTFAIYLLLLTTYYRVQRTLARSAATWDWNARLISAARCCCCKKQRTRATKLVAVPGDPLRIGEVPVLTCVIAFALCAALFAARHHLLPKMVTVCMYVSLYVCFRGNVSLCVCVHFLAAKLIDRQAALPQRPAQLHVSTRGLNQN